MTRLSKIKRFVLVLGFLMPTVFCEAYGLNNKVYRLLSDCDTDLVIQNVSGITNYTPGVKSSITITPSNSITIPANTNHIMRAENFIQCSGEFTIPLGSEVIFMVHSCTDIQNNY